MQSIRKRRKTVWLAGVIPALLLGIFCGAEEYVVQIDGVIWPETGMTVGESLQRNTENMTADIGTLDHLTWYIDGREEALRETDVFEAGRDYLLWMRLDLFTEEEYIARAELPKDAQEQITAAVTINGEALAENRIQCRRDGAVFLSVPVTMPEGEPWIPVVSYDADALSLGRHTLENVKTIPCMQGERLTLTARETFADSFTVLYQWYRTEENGTDVMLEGECMPTLAVPSDTVGTAQYFCTVMGSDGKSLYSSRIMPEMCRVKVETVSYTLPFQDVPEDAWYREAVTAASLSGLVNGMTEDTYAPDENMTLAECIKLAACFQQWYRDGEVTLENGRPWYKSYELYAMENRLIDKWHTEEEMNSPVTRAAYVDIFCYTMPAEALRAIREIPMGSIPDVPEDHPYAGEIYKMYAAGILNGMDAEGSFGPDEYIRRSEVAAVLVRMMDTAYRIRDSAESAVSA